MMDPNQGPFLQPPFVSNSLPGLFGRMNGWIPPESLALPPFSPPLPTDAVLPPLPPLADAFYPGMQPPNAPPPEKKHPWYVTFAKEALKTGFVVAASIGVGLLTANPLAGIAAGAVASGAINALDQKLDKRKHGQIDWGSVAIDTALGAIPGAIGGRVVGGLEKLLAKEGLKKLAARVGGQKALAAVSEKIASRGVGGALTQSMARTTVEGVTDGAAMGYLGGLSQTAYGTYRDHGQINWSEANKAGLASILPGMIGGGAGAAGIHALSGHLRKRAAAGKPNATTDNAPMGPDAPGGGKTLHPAVDGVPPRRSLANRVMGAFLHKSEDPLIANFHQVDSHLLRGAMPESAEAYARLAQKHGVKTVVDLRGPQTTRPEHLTFARKQAADHGMAYVHLGMDSHQPPNPAQLKQFLDTVLKARHSGGPGGKVYVHCKHGIDRTGVMTAAYEVLQGKTPQQAYEAMTQHGYNWQHQWSRPDQKSYVLDGDLQTMVADYRKTARINGSGDSFRPGDLTAGPTTLQHQDSVILENIHPQSKPPVSPTASTSPEKQAHLKRQDSFIVENIPPASEPVTPPQGPESLGSPTASLSRQNSLTVETIHPEKSGRTEPSPAALSRQALDVQVFDTVESPPVSPRAADQSHTGIPAQGPAVSPRLMSDAEMKTYYGAAPLTELHFQQSGLNSCHTLSGVKAILDHPQGEALLKKIRFEALPDNQYRVYFPADLTHPETVSGQPNAAGQGVHTEHLGIRLIEKAALQKLNRLNEARLQRDFNAKGLPRPADASTFRSSQHALKNLFWNRHLKDFDDINFDAQDPKTMGTFFCDESGPVSAVEQAILNFKEYQRNIQRETHPHADILTAAPYRDGRLHNQLFTAGHYYAVRLSPEHIHLSDPFDTRRILPPLTPEQFFQVFKMEGVRLPLIDGRD